jgi:type I restriction enzyme S subunit
MPNNWKTYKLPELGILARGKSKHRPRDASHLYGGKYPFIQTGDVKSANHKLFSHKQTYSEDGLAQSKLWPKGTMCITIAANIAETSILTYPACFPDSIIGFIPDEDKCDIDFIEFMMQYFKKEVQSHSIGSVQDNINLGTFDRLEFLIPPLHEQTQIAQILSAIDDKIENNLATNKTLEDMAMALYKYWFVDFGPFQEGEFIDSELGLIPEGWEVKPFLDMFELLSGGTPKTSIHEYWNGQINWVSAKDIGSSGSIYINDTEKKITQLGLDKSATKILPEDTVIVVARGSVGKFGMITKPMCMNQSCYGIFSKSNYSQSIMYLLIDSLMKHFLNVAYGSVFDTITTSTFKSINVLEPPKSVMDKVKGEIDVLFQHKKTNIKEIKSLTKLRDTLLPKLISGEVRLTAFREEVESVIAR